MDNIPFKLIRNANITGGSVDVGADQRDQECDGEQQSSCGRRLGHTRQSPHDSSSRVSLLSSNSLNPPSTADLPWLKFFAPRIPPDTDFVAVLYVCVVCCPAALNLIYNKIRSTATLETQTHTQCFLPVSCNTAIVFLQVEMCQSQPTTKPLVTYELVAALS